MLCSRTTPESVSAEKQRGETISRADTTRQPLRTTPEATLTDDQLELAKNITDHVLDSMERQLWRSYAIARTGKYAKSS